MFLLSVLERTQYFRRSPNDSAHACFLSLVNDAVIVFMAALQKKSVFKVAGLRVSPLHGSHIPFRVGWRVVITKSIALRSALHAHNSTLSRLYFGRTIGVLRGKGT